MLSDNGAAGPDQGLQENQGVAPIFDNSINLLRHDADVAAGRSGDIFAVAPAASSDGQALGTLFRRFSFPGHDVAAAAGGHSPVTGIDDARKPSKNPAETLAKSRAHLITSPSTTASPS
jgi:hypothetical protein